MNALLCLALLPAAEPTVDNSFLRDYAATRGFLLGRPTKPKPTPDGSAVLFLRSPARTPQNSLYEFDVATKQTRELASPATLLAGADENLSPEEKARRERQRVSVGGFADFQLDEDGKRVLLQLAGRLYLLDRKSGKADELATGPGVIDPKFSPDGSKVAYVREYDLYVYDVAAKRERRLTEGGTAAKTHGLAEFVAQEEMGRHTGFWWSPDSKQIAYEEADAAGVEVWYVADPMEPGKPPQPQYYPRPGQKNVSVRLGVIGVEGGATTWVEWDRAKYEYLASVRWDKHGPLTVLVQDRHQQEQMLSRVDVSTGKTAMLRTERVPSDPAWINLPQTDLPRWREDGSGFLWVTESESGPILGRFSPNGSRLMTGFDGEQGFRELLAFDPRTGHALCLANRGTQLTEFHESSDAESAFKPNPNPALSTLVLFQPGGTGGGMGSPSRFRRLLFPPNHGDIGGLSATMTRDQSRIVLTATRTDRMPQTTVLRTEDHVNSRLRELTLIPSVAEEPPFKPNVVVEKVGDFWTAVVRPRDFDPKKKYPVLVDVYGGPHHLHVVAAMRNWLLPQWLADQGFVVVAIDGRGTPHRGRDWERAIYQKFGSVPLDDQVAGLQALGAKFPELDLARVGIVGWSFGGYMSALAVLKRPDVFHAAVAGAPVCDWLDYDTHYTERYLGLPQENPDAYRDASLLTYANKLTRPLLVVHGTADDNVFFRHSLKLTDALFRNGQPFEALPLPGLTHMVPDPVVTERLWERIAKHFRTHLQK
ncbi:MAG: prolyl oligopeptidase family serine peptidase [Gemmataceae bacterium]